MKMNEKQRLAGLRTMQLNVGAKSTQNQLQIYAKSVLEARMQTNMNSARRSSQHESQNQLTWGLN